MQKLIPLTCALIFTLLAVILVLFLDIHMLVAILTGIVFGSLSFMVSAHIIDKLEK